MRRSTVIPLIGRLGKRVVSENRKLDAFAPDLALGLSSNSAPGCSGRRRTYHEWDRISARRAPSNLHRERRTQRIWRPNSRRQNVLPSAMSLRAECRDSARRSLSERRDFRDPPAIRRGLRKHRDRGRRCVVRASLARSLRRARLAARQFASDILRTAREKRRRRSGRKWLVELIISRSAQRYLLALFTKRLGNQNGERHRSA